MKLFSTQKNTSLAQKKGFTLLETLVAISILIVAITATFSAAQNGLASSLDARDQIIAFYLAQESVEMVRNSRDANSLARITAPGTSWLQGLAATVSDPCAFGKSCTVDATTNTFVACPSGQGSCTNLRQDVTTGMYGYNTNWNTTIFNREITLSQASASELVIDVTVTWTHGVIRSFRVNEVLQDWQ